MIGEIYFLIQFKKGGFEGSLRVKVWRNHRLVKCQPIILEKIIKFLKSIWEQYLLLGISPKITKRAF